MVRLLFIGRPADNWATRIGEIVGDGVDFDTARLPSSGVRRFEETPADLVVAVDNRGDGRVGDLAEAIRQRPLGRLVPLIVIAPPPDDADTRCQRLGLSAWLDTETAPSIIVDTIDEALETDLRTIGSPNQSGTTAGDTPSSTSGDDSSPRPPDTTGDDGASYFGGDVVLEPVDGDDGPRQVDRSSIFRNPDGGRDVDDDAPDAEAIERKLEAVRHRDYFEVLEVRRGAETQAIREAFHRLYARFDPDRLDFQLLRDHRGAIDEIRDALEDAFAVLGDPELRRAYREHTVK